VHVLVHVPVRAGTSPYKRKGGDLSPPQNGRPEDYFFFFGAAFLVAFLVFTFGSPLSMHERKRNRRGEGSTPPHSRGAYFFFFEPPFFAAFFFAAIVVIPPFGPGLDRCPRQRVG
jgi:hypothetical protein